MILTVNISGRGNIVTLLRTVREGRMCIVI